MQFNVDTIRKDFPILQKKVYDKPLAYLDNAATTQKPQAVIDRITYYYSSENSNIHRGVHYLSQIATEAFELARENIQQFINAEKSHEVIFTKGTTDAINLVATSFGKNMISKNDEIIISTLEHHSNLVPWQMVCQEKGAKLKVIPINEKGEILFEQYEQLLNKKTKLVAISHVSNALGTIIPIEEIIKKAHDFKVPVLIDGAQAAAHIKIDVQKLDCDFYCFSGHKVYGPMGSGILYGKERYLEKMEPYQYGGEMIKRVTFKKTTFNELPFKFEAGTPNVEAILGLNAAIKYLEEIGLDKIAKYEENILNYATNSLEAIGDIKIIGTSDKKTSIVSFLIGDIHPYDAGTIIDKFGIAIRTGHHCAQPLMDWFNISGTVRASLAMYNTIEEIDRLAEAIVKVKEMFV
ncbi:MAG: cysteine desulfurase [Bacteroidetes bacterium]|nr:cysteine desulfurase [Bacteroidota bacterium]